MKALIQRVSEARVEVAGETVGAIGMGLLLFVCFEPGDHTAILTRMAAKIARLRIFEDEAGKMNRSLLEVGGEVLVVSQFTLAADLRRGNRPDFTAAAPPQLAQALFEAFCQALAQTGLRVASGRFAARMQVYLVNNGPLTIWLDSAMFASPAPIKARSSSSSTGSRSGLVAGLAPAKDRD